MRIPIKKADILIPRNIDMEKWAVIACDQYTSEIEYWKKAEEIVGECPSTLRLMVPEVYLEEKDIQERIKNVNRKMDEYISTDLFNILKDSAIYVRRAQSNGNVREGIVLAVDLEGYSYEKGSESLVRATEETVLERIPPRVRIRENASLELPHVMLLIDDYEQEIIEEVRENVEDNEMIYDFDLMQNGGHITGYKLKEDQIQKVFNKIEKLSDNENFNKRYNTKDKKTLLFAVGDGNHSLATAKACYENLKKKISKEEYENHPARYALVEIVNLYSKGLEFEPIHRVLFGVEPEKVITELKKYYEVSQEGEGQKIGYIYKDSEGVLIIKNPKSNLAVGTLQIFIDEYLKNNSGKVDYIHGDEVTKRLAKAEGNIGFLLPNMEKNELFKTVILDGILPRKTFSMGHSNDKRYYLEARKIKE